MPSDVFNCLVKITRANVSDPRVVKCFFDGEPFLAIPVDDYAVPQAGERKVMVLHAPPCWVAEIVGAAEHDMICRKVIDLDKFDELPWSE